MACGCCGLNYRFCIVNSNQIRDNAWDVTLNGTFLGNYSGGPFVNVCFPISNADIKEGEENTLDFSLTACTFDDYFEFQIQRGNAISGYISIFQSNSGFINGSFFINGTCTTTQFSRTFTINPLP